jgi:hypothetical protein
MATKRKPEIEDQEPLIAQSTPGPEDTLRNIDQLSRGAFTAFAERMQYKDYSNMSLPLYHEMTAVQKSAWETVVRVIYGALP